MFYFIIMPKRHRRNDKNHQNIILTSDKNYTLGD